MLKLQKADYQYDTKKKKHSMSKKKFNRKKNLQVNGNPAAKPLLFGLLTAIIMSLRFSLNNLRPVNKPENHIKPKAV